MAILGKIYDAATHTDKVWYDSSNVVYSRFVENENDNNGQLYVTFKNGATYHYKDVDMPTDYILFKTGGIDNSQGKALNKQIKGKYDYERVQDENVTLLMEELEKLNNPQDSNEEETQEETTNDWENKFYSLFNVANAFVEDLSLDIESGNIKLEESRQTWNDLREILKNI